MSILRKCSAATVLTGTVMLFTWGGCSGGMGGTPAADAASTFDEASSIAAVCSNPDAGLMPTGEGTFSAADFCKLYLATCQGLANSLPDMSSCLANYNAAANLMSGNMQHCRSNHICNAAVFFPAAYVVHCGHAIGIDLCN